MNTFSAAFEDLYAAFWNTPGRWPVAFDASLVAWNAEPLEIARELYNAGTRIDWSLSPTDSETRAAAVAANDRYNSKNQTPTVVYTGGMQARIDVRFLALFLRASSAAVATPTSTDSLELIARDFGQIVARLDAFIARGKPE